MKYLLFIVLLVAILITAGCVNLSLPSISKSNDDTYIENLENFFIQQNESVNRIFNGQDLTLSKSQEYAADMKILSKTYYDRIQPLKVSSKLELSKNSFLQYLTEIGIISEIQMNTTSLLPINQEEQKHSDFSRIYLQKTFNSELFSVMAEKKITIVVPSTPTSTPTPVPTLTQTFVKKTHPTELDSFYQMIKNASEVTKSPTPTLTYTPTPLPTVTQRPGFVPANPKQIPVIVRITVVIVTPTPTAVKPIFPTPTPSVIKSNPFPFPTPTPTPLPVPNPLGRNCIIMESTSVNSDGQWRVDGSASNMGADGTCIISVKLYNTGGVPVGSSEQAIYISSHQLQGFSISITELSKTAIDYKISIR
jgi:hypothetical protein